MASLPMEDVEPEEGDVERAEKGREDGERGEQRLQIKDTMLLHSTQKTAATEHRRQSFMDKGTQAKNLQCPCSHRAGNQKSYQVIHAHCCFHL